MNITGSSVASQIDRLATINNTKAFLKEYQSWYLQKRKIESWKRFDFSKEASLSKEKIAKINLECELRTQTLSVMKSTNENLAFLADILEMRYIKLFQLKKVCTLLADKYELDYISERTLSRYQNEALLIFALACPRDLTVLKI